MVTQQEVHKLACEKGWWPSSDVPEDHLVPAKLALIHSEVSEALEAFREDDAGSLIITTYHGDKPVGFGIELADIVIRTMDLAEYMGINLWDLVRTKHEYNKGRPHRHGGKRV